MKGHQKKGEDQNEEGEGVSAGRDMIGPEVGEGEPEEEREYEEDESGNLWTSGKRSELASAEDDEIGRRRTSMNWRVSSRVRTCRRAKSVKWIRQLGGCVAAASETHIELEDEDVIDASGAPCE